MQETIPLRVIAPAIVVVAAVIALMTTTSIQRVYAPMCPSCAPSHQSTIIGSGLPGGIQQSFHNNTGTNATTSSVTTRSGQGMDVGPTTRGGTTMDIGPTTRGGTAK